MEPSTSSTTPADEPQPREGPAIATQTAQGELPLLPATPSTLLGRVLSSPIPALTNDLRAGPALDDLMTRAVEGARREGSGRAITWGIAVVLGAVLALRVIFDDVLPKLLLVGVLGAVLVAVVALVGHSLLEARRQRLLLEVLSQLTRLAEHDAAMRARVGPQIEAVVEALRAPSVMPFFERLRKDS